MLNLKDDGTAIVTIGDDKHNLRRPTIGEYRKVREYSKSLDTERLAKEEANPELRSDIVHLDDYFIAYHRMVFEILSDKVLPESSDDLPMWFASAELGRHLLVHWRNVPLAPSSMPPEGR